MKLRFACNKFGKRTAFNSQTRILCLENQKQPPELFCKKRCSQKFHKENTCARVSFLMKLQACARTSFSMKLQACARVSFFNKVADLRLFLQNTSGGWFWKTSHNQVDKIINFIYQRLSLRYRKFIILLSIAIYLCANKCIEFEVKWCQNVSIETLIRASKFNSFMTEVVIKQKFALQINGLVSI